MPYPLASWRYPVNSDDHRRARLLELVEEWRETGWLPNVRLLHGVFADAFYPSGAPVGPSRESEMVYRRAVALSTHIETDEIENLTFQPGRFDMLFAEVNGLANRLEEQLENASDAQILSYFNEARAPYRANPVSEGISLAISLAGLALTGIAVYYGTRPKPAPALTPSAPLSMLLTKGTSYHFVLSAPTDPTSWLNTLQATVQGTPTQAAPFVGIAANNPWWTGTFTWNGTDQSPIPTPEGVQWITVSAVGGTAPAPAPSPGTPSPSTPGAPKSFPEPSGLIPVYTGIVTLTPNGSNPSPGTLPTAADAQAALGVQGLTGAVTPATNGAFRVSGFTLASLPFNGQMSWTSGNWHAVLDHIVAR